MKRIIAIFLTLSLSMIFGVDASKDLETQPQTNSTEMTLDIENVQEIRQMKESLNESFKQARKAKGIPKPNKAQLNPLQKKAAFPFKAIKEKSKKSFKESINIVNKKDIKAKKETYLEKRELLKQKREEFKARAQDKRKRQSTEFIEIEKQKLAELKERRKSKKSKSSLLRNPKVSQIQEQHVRTISRTDNRNSRNGGMEFEFSSVWELYSEFGEVLLSIGDGCDGCEGNLGMMDEDDSFDITDSLAFYTWAEEFGFLSYYFQFIDENESGEYDDGEIYAISCEGGNFDAGYEGNMTVAYNGSVYHMIFEDFWMVAYDFNWGGDDEYDSFLEGLVMDFDGNPIANAEVYLETEWSGYHAYTNEEGYYHIESDSPGLFYIDAGADGYWMDITMVEINEGGTQYDFTLGLEEETALLEIWTGTTDWEPITLAELYSPQSPQELSMSNYAAWDYITVDPSEGFAEVIGEHPEYGGAYLNIEDVEAGNWYERVIYFEDNTNESGWLIVHVFDLDNNPINGAHVSIWNDEFDIDSMTDEDGHTIVELSEGYYEVDAWAEGFESEYYGEVEIYANGETEIEFYLEPDTGEEDFTFLGEFNGHEYYFSHFTDTWHNANDTLNQYDEAYLVSITSEEENNFLTDAVTSMTTNALHTGGFLSGYYGPWEWSNGEEWVYENWAEGQPDGSGGVLVFNDQSYGPGEWDDWSGGDSLQFIVEVEGDEDDEFEYLGELDGHEYYLSNFEATWNEANDMFSEWDDAHLVTISSQEENDLITETTGGDVWIGFTDQYEEGYWEWVTGEEVVYTNWGEDEPNNSGDGEHFALINNNGTWNDLHEEMLGFVVEVSDDSDGYVDCACDAEYHVGDRVVLTVDNPGGNDSLFAGATGTVYCGGESPWNAPLLVVWDPPNAGNDVNEYCECGDGDDIDMENSGWWVSCDVIEMDGGDEHGWLEGHIFDQDGNPLQDAAIEGWNEEGGWSTYTDEGGYFSIELSAGYYELEAHMDGFLSQWSDVEIYPGETSYVEFWLEWEEDHTHVYGYVTNVDGEPLEMAQIIAHDPEELGINGMTFADEEGYYGFDLPEDEYVFSIRREGYWVHWSDSYFVSGDDMELSWELESVDEFDGGWEGNIELIGGGGDPESIYFTIFNNEYDVVRILDGPGFYEVPLVNGTYNIYVSASGYESVYMPDAVHIENNVVNLDVQLQYGMVLPPHIEWHGDVPNDQGRQMRLVWNPGMPGDWDFFPFYSIWRLVDEAPMELWDFIDMVPWHGMDPYSAVVPTLGDSTDMGIHWSTFRVTAHTEDPNEFYDSEPVSGYSIDNLHPGAPNGVQAFTGEEGIVLTWDPPMDEDFGYHRVYRYDLSSEDPAEEFTTVDTFFVDATTSGNYEYWITAVDLNGNESDPSEVVAVMLALEDGLAIPSEFALKQNYPNPFNPSTQIQYALPTDANVSIAIYDLMGRQIRSLVNEQVNAGYHSTLWNATNDLGSPVSAGVYIYTIEANNFRDVKKMILLK